MTTVIDNTTTQTPATDAKAKVSFRERIAHATATAKASGKTVSSVAGRVGLNTLKVGGKVLSSAYHTPLHLLDKAPGAIATVVTTVAKEAVENYKKA